MRVLVVDPYYPDVLEGHYRLRPELTAEPYDVQWQALMGSAFGTSDAYSHNLRALGHEAHEVIPNCRPLQRAWAREHAPRAARLPWRVAAPAILLAQAGWFRPDVVYVQSVGAFHPLLLRRLRRGARLLAGQIASRLPQGERLGLYDVIFTSFPHFVERLGVPTHLLRIGFDERIAARVAGETVERDVVFVGQLGGLDHRQGNAVIEAAARELPIDVWGPGTDEWPDDSPFRTRHRGVVWGIDMYRALASARIALNRHIAAANGHANNMRLYEATGVGTMLLTEESEDLDALFEPGREAVTYADPHDLVETARWYLAHEDERAAIASAGRARTLAEHTYAARIAELVSILERYLR
jgi:spore maturation protein CgeB